MARNRHRSRIGPATRWSGLLGLLMLAALGACDTVEPVEDGVLVVEGFLDTGEPLPRIVLRQTRPLDEPYPDDASTAAEGADVQVRLDGQVYAYHPVPDAPGRYEPEPDHAGVRVPPRAGFDLRVRWESRQATVEGRTPPPIAIDSVVVAAADEPVEAVLLDSLYVTDSVGVSAQTGYIYPVEVTLWWTLDYAETGPDSLYWIQTRLRPYTRFSSTIVDFFLRPEQVLRERAMPRDARGRRHWTGVYAVPVRSREAALPEHDLVVALVRSGRDYARFASSRDAPERREPRSNLTGAIGIFAGIAVDSVRVHVR